jgi:hypothetical protein
LPFERKKPVQILQHLKHSKEPCGRRGKAEQSKRTVFNNGVLIHVGQNKSSGAKLFATRDRVYYIDRHGRLVHFDRSNTKHGMRAIHILAVLLLLAAGAAAGAVKKACHGGDEAALLA